MPFMYFRWLIIWTMVYYKVVLYTIALLHVANCKTVIAIHEPIKREISQALSLFFCMQKWVWLVRLVHCYQLLTMKMFSIIWWLCYSFYQITKWSWMNKPRLFYNMYTSLLLFSLFCIQLYIYLTEWENSKTLMDKENSDFIFLASVRIRHLWGSLIS